MISPKMQKTAFLIILVLLLIFVPLGGYSLYLHISKNVKPKNPAFSDNPNKELYYNGMLWFYNASGEVLGTYTCEHPNCRYAISYENDKDYPIDYYQSKETSYIPVILDQYVFIQDNETEESTETFLYDIKNNFSYKSVSYDSIKNYQIGLANSYFIVENKEHKFGILQVDLLATLVVPYSYDFIGVIDDKVGEPPLTSSSFVAEEGSEWYIINANDEKLTQSILEPIVTYNDTYIITEKNELNHLMNYSGEQVLEGDFVSLAFIDKYISCQTVEGTFYIYDMNTNEVISEVHEIEEDDTVSAKRNETGEIEIEINANVVETLSFT